MITFLSILAVVVVVGIIGFCIAERVRKEDEPMATMLRDSNNPHDMALHFCPYTDEARVFKKGARCIFCQEIIE